MANIAVVSPVRPRSTSGNNVTSNRWAKLLEAVGHQVLIIHHYEEDPIGPEDARLMASADLLVALHARRNAKAVQWWKSQKAESPLVVALTGTDLYADLPADKTTIASVDAADALIVLQSEAVARLNKMKPSWGDLATVVHQSVAGPHPDRQPVAEEFRVVVLAHLRAVKDPLLAARAARHLPLDSTISVHHAGGGIDSELTATAKREQEENGRYRWYGELDRQKARELLATADVLACTSVSEGGANVVSEAIALGIPVVGTRIDGNAGLVGRSYPGLVPVGDDRALGDLLLRLERDPNFLDELQRQTDERQYLTRPANEQAALVAIIERLVG